MKVQSEITFILDKEPEEFKNIDIFKSRTIYVWQNRRGYLSTEEPWITFSRKSVTETLNVNGFMEIWLEDKDICDSPNKPDDMWLETYKSIDKKNHILEWHPTQNMLRLVWSQTMETIKQQKLVSSIISSLNQLDLTFPGFPSFIPSST